MSSENIAETTPEEVQSNVSEQGVDLEALISLPEEKVEGKDAIESVPEKVVTADEFDAAKPDVAAPEEEFEGQIDGVQLKLPPGMKSDNAELAEFVKMFKESGAKPDQGQKFLDMYMKKQGEVVDTYEKNALKFRDNCNRKWIDENLKNPELGGTNYNASCGYITSALRRFLTKDELMYTMEKDGKMGFLEFVNQANIKNHPIMFTLLARAGKMSGEAGPVTTDASSDNRKKSVSREDALFGDIK